MNDALSKLLILGEWMNILYAACCDIDIEFNDNVELIVEVRLEKTPESCVKGNNDILF